MQAATRTPIHSREYPGYRSNAIVSVLRTVLWRFSNIFRAEGLVISSLITYFGVSNVILSVFPFLKRLGTIIPQIVLASRVRHKQIKKNLFTTPAILFGCVWIVLGVFLARYGDSGTPAQIIITIATIYFIAMLILAACNLSNQLLRAKLLPPNRRGRLQALALFIWTPLSVILSLLVIRPMLLSSESSVSVYGLFFILAGGAFLLLGIINTFYVEKPDLTNTQKRSFMAESLEAFRTQSAFRRILVIRGGVFLLFSSIPFYTAFGRQITESVGVPWEALIGICLIALEIGKVSGTAIIGLLADRFGNRLPLVLTLFLHVLWPLLALALGMLITAGALTAELYFIVFLVRGFGHPLMFISTNYLLEAADDDYRPIYIASGNLMRIVSLILIPILGLIADLLGLEAVFILLAAVSGGLALVALRIEEPRNKPARTEKIVTLE